MKQSGALVPRHKLSPTLGLRRSLVFKTCDIWPSSRAVHEELARMLSPWSAKPPPYPPRVTNFAPPGPLHVHNLQVHHFRHPLRLVSSSAGLLLPRPLRVMPRQVVTDHASLTWSSPQTQAPEIGISMPSRALVLLRSLTATTKPPTRLPRMMNSARPGLRHVHEVQVDCFLHLLPVIIGGRHLTEGFHMRWTCNMLWRTRTMAASGVSLAMSKRLARVHSLWSSVLATM
mmetsp:Transcript_60290/g.152623  ORF Transcript_60290/g.152623 Transcript_60290/m.152623 type:complete len:230 (+) Transcript_60290:237-926(+)